MLETSHGKAGPRTSNKGCSDKSDSLFGPKSADRNARIDNDDFLTPCRRLGLTSPSSTFRQLLSAEHQALDLRLFFLFVIIDFDFRQSRRISLCKCRSTEGLVSEIRYFSLQKRGLALDAPLRIAFAPVDCIENKQCRYLGRLHQPSSCLRQFDCVRAFFEVGLPKDIGGKDIVFD